MDASSQTALTCRTDVRTVNSHFAAPGSEERPIGTGEQHRVLDERVKRPVFGALLRARRVAAGFTQDELAERARISVQAVSALERGARHAPRGETLALLSRALELDGDAVTEFEAAARASAKPKVRATQPLFKAPSSKRARLPQFGTPFVGRDRAARELAAAVAGRGCTTLWGTGGVGKTRLAVEMTALVEERFERIVFVALAATIGDVDVDGAIAAALGIVCAGGEDVLARIVADLRDRSCLVILDNCEQVVAGAARAVAALVAALPGTAFVCTSREPLRIAGERVIGVGPLDASDARRMFVDLAATAATAAASTALSPADVRDVATICHKLDGIPLALELAAACARVLDLAHVASGLDARFRLLTRGSRAASDRHTTLRATIAWSYDLLDAPERHVFERAAIVNGRFTLDDALAIAGDDAHDRASVLVAMTELVAKSLVVVEDGGETSRRRYRLLDSMRAFALETAEARKGDATFAEAQRRYGRYLSERLRRSVSSYRGGAGSPLGDVDLDHVRGYLDWAIDKRNDIAAGTSLAGEMHLVWDFSGLHAEGIRRAEAGLALLTSDGVDAGDGSDDKDASAAMHACYAIARLNQRLVRIAESLAPGVRAYGLAARIGDDPIRASSAAKLAVAYDAAGRRGDALAYAREAMAVFERIGDAQSAAYAAFTAAVISFRLRGDDAALEGLRVAVERQRSLGDDRRTASAELELGEALYARADVAAAIATVHSAIRQFRKTASRFELAIGLTNLCAYLCTSGRESEAAPFAIEALAIGRDGRYTRMIALAAQACATIAALAQREPARCVQLFGYVARRYETIGEIGFTEAAAHQRLRGAVDGCLPERDFAAAMRAGAAFDDETAVDVAFRCAPSDP